MTVPAAFHWLCLMRQTASGSCPSHSIPYLKENESGTVGERRIDWKTVTTTTFDKKWLKEEHREIYEEYCGKGMSFPLP